MDQGRVIKVEEVMTPADPILDSADFDEVQRSVTSSGDRLVVDNAGLCIGLVTKADLERVQTQGTPTLRSAIRTDVPVANPYSTYSGVETFKYYVGEEAGALDCDMTWTMEGSPWEDIQECDGCEFVFDIVGTYDAENSIADAEVGCDSLAADMSFAYGYIDDYYGYGGYVMYYSADYGYFSAWTGASFEGGTFTYSYGYEDWDYYKNGTYYTYLWAGEAAVE